MPTPIPSGVVRPTLTLQVSLDPPLPSQVLLDLYTPTLTGAALLDLPLPPQVLLDLSLPSQVLPDLPLRYPRTVSRAGSV